MKGTASRRTLSVLLCCVTTLLAAGADARKVSGVTMPESTSVDGRMLRLNGMGLLKRMTFKVYVAGLYLERPTRDPQAAITTDAAKRMLIAMLRDVDRDAFAESVEKGMQQNSGPVMHTLRKRLNRLKRALPDIKKGNVIDITYVPGVGTLVRAQDKQLMIEGKDFADAMFLVWLGKDPPDRDLKRKLLGR